MTTQLTGRLEAVDPRRIWATEEGDFIPWLSEAGNLQLLGDAIGLDLELGRPAERIGSGGAGLTCRDAKGELVVVENQLDPTDHQRLGQLLTHTAALKAATTVWIASRFSDEHRAAVDRLNQMTTKRFSFFGVEIEAWKIQDSPPAPRFLLVSKPRRTAEYERGVRERLELVLGR